VKQIKEALYQQMRYNILKSKYDDFTNSPFSNSYVYAWNNHIYPFAHEDFDGENYTLHQIYHNEFYLNKKLVEDVYDYIKTHIQEEKKLNYPDVTSKFNKHKNEKYDIYYLGKIITYIYYANIFKDKFWNEFFNVEESIKEFSIEELEF